MAGYALVDQEDYERFGHLSWSLGSHGYAFRNVRAESRTTVLLHREILGLVPGDGLEGEHKNRNRFDYRRENLRIVTHAQNSQNLNSFPGTSRYRGVGRKRDRWRAFGKLGGKYVHLGHFIDEEEAARVAAEWRRDHLPFSEGDK